MSLFFGLITRRLQVQILPPLPEMNYKTARLNSDGLFYLWLYSLTTPLLQALSLGLQ